MSTGAWSRVRIFLSFNSKDKDLAHSTRAGLLKLDSAADIFLDEISLDSGFWLPKIFGRIADSDAFLFLIGPHGIGQWQEVENFSAFQRHVEERGKMPLVPVIAAKAEAPGLAGLRSLNWVVAPDLQNDSTLHRILTALKIPSGEAVRTRVPAALNATLEVPLPRRSGSPIAWPVAISKRLAAPSSEPATPATSSPARSF
jgi:hypothetical protein